tara:strand:- start:93 stop:278 length:186 start_codon:yes stop_codon:yes gene_type:complete
MHLAGNFFDKYMWTSRAVQTPKRFIVRSPALGKRSGIKACISSLNIAKLSVINKSRIEFKW